MNWWPVLIAILLLTTTVSAVPVSYVAGQRGRGEFGWFLFGFIFGPIVGLLALIALPVQDATPRLNSDEVESLVEKRRRMDAEREGRPSRGGTLRP